MDKKLDFADIFCKRDFFRGDCQVLTTWDDFEGQWSLLGIGDQCYVLPFTNAVQYDNTFVSINDPQFTILASVVSALTETLVCGV